jgi:hypothetical protein
MFLLGNRPVSWGTTCIKDHAQPRGPRAFQIVSNQLLHGIILQAGHSNTHPVWNVLDIGQMGQMGSFAMWMLRIATVLPLSITHGGNISSDLSAWLAWC